MRFLRLLWRRFTLLCILVLTALPLTILGWTGRNSLYSEYEFAPMKEPGLYLVFRGIHDGVYPWSGLIKPGPEESAEEAGVESSSVEEAPESDAAEAVTGSGTEPQAVTESVTGAASEQAQASDTAAAAAGSTQAAPAEEAARDTYTESEDQAVEKIELLPQNAVTGDTDTIPDGVCNPVMQSEDYGVVNVAFLSPDDTEYNTDTEGIFAKNGVYYLLGSVDASYFGDALFIGDSRTVGLCEYGSLKENAAFLAKESINVYNVLDQELRFTDHDGETWDDTVEETLKNGAYGKVYVALGVNELGIGNTYMYYEKYREILEMIREYQPAALIYIQGIMHVSYEKSSSDSCRNNTVISQRNYAISTLANGRDIFYIDMNPYVCDADGDLLPDLSGDGIHLKASAYEKWDRSLMENAVVLGPGQ